MKKIKLLIVVLTGIILLGCNGIHTKNVVDTTNNTTNNINATTKNITESLAESQTEIESEVEELESMLDLTLVEAIKKELGYEELGKVAQELEYAAGNGKLDIIKSKTMSLIEKVEKGIDDINNIF